MAGQFLPMAKVFPAGKTGFHTSIHDYADAQISVASFGAARVRRLAAKADMLYARADTRDAISDAMVADLRARTGASGTVSHAGLEQSDFEYLANKRRNHQDTIRIAYAGSNQRGGDFYFVRQGAGRRARRTFKACFH